MDSKEELQVEPRRPDAVAGSRCRAGAGRIRRAWRSRRCSRRSASYNPKGDMRLLERAYRFSEEAHDGQSRLSGAPFIEHPLAVAEILADLRLDTTTLTAALLHDTVEDTDVTLEVITERFGDDVTRIVDGLTKLDRLQFRTRELAQAENVRKMIVAMAGDIRVLLDQAGRPAPQHADGLGARAGEADAHGHRDARDLRAPGEPARRPGGQVGARGPVVQDAPSGPLQGDRAARRDPPR